MRILFTCLLLVLLFATGFSQWRGNKMPEKKKNDHEAMNNDIQKRYEKFNRQHINKKMTKKKCDSVMKSRKIYNNDNSCKEINTFILSDPKKVKSICKDCQSRCRTRSKEMFRIVVCERKKGARKPRCEYKGKELANQHVVVECEQGLPVHFYSNKVNLRALLLHLFQTSVSKAQGQL